MASLLLEHIQKEEGMFDRGEERMAAIEAELAPIKKMYWAVIGSASIGLFLLMSLIYIYQNDRADSKLVQQSIYQQGVTIERMLAAQEELRRNQTKVDTVIERLLERMISKS